MKTISLLSFITAVAVTPAAFAQVQVDKETSPAKRNAAAQMQVRHYNGAAVQAQRNFSRQQTARQGRRFSSAGLPTRINQPTANVQIRNWQRRHNAAGVQNWRNRSDDENHTRVWSGSAEQGRNRINEIGRHHAWNRVRHDRGWWRSRYNRFALFGGGYYYWNNGFWYPAYGYDPYFTTYSYDAPLYAYQDQDPGQVIANVQSALQQQGYYRGELDGTYGPLTRRALLGFQADNGLPRSGQIDQDTLNALGLD